MFITEYIKNPTVVGAVAPSSKKLAKCMMKPIDFNSCSCVVEYGAGTGVFTNEIIKRKNKNTVLLIIEKNENFYNILCEKFNNLKNVYIINGDVQNLKEYMIKYNIEKIDYIISGLPFTIFSEELSENILSNTKNILSENGGKFITFQYTLVKKELFRRFFDIENIDWIFINMPPAFVLTMS